MTDRCASEDQDRTTPDELAGKCDLGRLGIDPGEVRRAELIHDGHDSHVYRIVTAEESFVLKWFTESAQAHEVRCYTLLQNHAVPTLPVHGWAEDAILLEDLTVSATWRPAAEADVDSPEVGAAVAEWYRALHAAGREILADPAETPPFLAREVDALTPPAVLEIGEKLGLSANPVWRLAADSVEALVDAMLALPETLNYNDFHWTNLALSRERRPSLQAIVYDYHLMGIGPAYSDCRNVLGSLGKEARAAFMQAYGPVDERVALLDAPLSVLFGLSVAVQRPHLPGWAEDLLRRVESGQLESDIRRALEAL
jgi:hypothetical protein